MFAASIMTEEQGSGAFDQPLELRDLVSSTADIKKGMARQIGQPLWVRAVWLWKQSEVPVEAVKFLACELALVLGCI